MPAQVPQTPLVWEPDALIPNTLRVPARARKLVRLRHADDLPLILDAAQAAESPLLVLGA